VARYRRVASPYRPKQNAHKGHSLVGVAWGASTADPAASRTRQDMRGVWPGLGKGAFEGLASRAKAGDSDVA
jgi:hypothetical protein